MVRQFRFLRGAFACLVFTAASWAQSSGTGFHSESPEDFRIEVTGAAWVVNSAGHLLSHGLPVDFVSDLNLGQDRPTFYGQLVFKPGRKHRIIVEGTPFGEDGSNTIHRTITYQGRSFNFNDTIQSSANLNYVFAGYQYDILSGPKGHLGLSAGGAYLSAYGSILATGESVPVTGRQKVGLPLAGIEFRVFPIPHHRILEFDGGVRGMAFGGYGYFVESSGNAGLCFGPVTFQAGYRATNLDLHNNHPGANGLTARLQGPIFSGLFRW